MAAFSFGQAGRITAGALTFLAFGACAEGTNQSDLGPLTQGMAGTTSGGSDTGAAGMPTAGTAGMPTAGTKATGGSSTAGSGGVAVTAGTGGAAGAGGSGGMSGGAGGRGGMGGVGGSSGGMAGSGGSGGSSAGAGGSSAGSGGGSATGHRYAKLVATSEVNGKVWSSVAELQIMTTGNVALSRTNWTVTADSEETDDQDAPATAAIDGDNATFWHTAWEFAPNDVNDAKLPHSLIVDLKTTQPITGFSYLPRQSGSNGRIEDWQFFVSKDGTTWGAAVKTGTFPDVATLQTVTF
ncbi:MAG TPA: discoidin domain-containing protein [Polyangiaceae bacterium]|nr:discoidin domain-containing protein [Polyangiaceae bacterium]